VSALTQAETRRTDYRDEWSTQECGVIGPAVILHADESEKIDSALQLALPPSQGKGNMSANFSRR